MGNSSSKDNRPAPRPDTVRHVSGIATSAQALPLQQTPTDRLVTQKYSGRNARGSRPDLPFLSLGRDGENGNAAPERPRETKQEKEARRAEKERQARVKDRERSMRDEGVDGGYLVTLGTYTGPEDFNKGIVRQLQVSDGRQV